MTAIAKPAPIAPDVAHPDTGETITVTMTLVDALSVGQSLRVQARTQKTPHGTREIYARVGQQMVSAAHVAMKQRTGAGRGRR